MIPLLLAVKKAHPEADAVCAGAILSTYQRTRVESVATRLGLVPLAYLWKFPVLAEPRLLGTSTQEADGAQLLRDLSSAGVEARIIKVASGGLDEGFLWENVASPAGIERVKRATRRFGSAGEGAVLGEGGEFETLVVDGPPSLFGAKIAIAAEDRRIIREGGGSAWLQVRKASIVPKPVAGDDASDGQVGGVRVPDLLDERFDMVLSEIAASEMGRTDSGTADQQGLDLLPSQSGRTLREADGKLCQWCVVGDVGCRSSIEEETSSLVSNIRDRLSHQALSPLNIISSIIVLRHMSDFPTINKIYGSLFSHPNPPARVTVSCGDQLPAGLNIAIFLSVLTGLQKNARQGLHVQSRSYWAPANIGPYSQAITLPISCLFPNGSCDDTTSGPRIVSIAGQIPLVPATMDLPMEPAPFGLQLVLSLQHLWRIGIEMKVQWWSSVVAYVPRARAPSSSIGEQARLAARAWRAAHVWSATEPDTDVEGPDLWDRKYDSRYISLAGGQKPDPKLPDWPALGQREPPPGGDETPELMPPHVPCRGPRATPSGAGRVACTSGLRPRRRRGDSVLGSSAHIGRVHAWDCATYRRTDPRWRFRAERFRLGLSGRQEDISPSSRSGGGMEGEPASPHRRHFRP